MLQKLLDAPRPTKRMISITYDCLALSFSFYLAWALRIDSFSIPLKQTSLICVGITITISIAAFIRLGLYRAILRYIAQDAVTMIAIGIIISSITLATTSFYLKSNIPRSVPIIYLFTACLLIGLPRILVRSLVQIFFPTGENKVLIYGAGNEGRMLADSLLQSHEYQTMAFLDDNTRYAGSKVKGLPVFSGNCAGEIIKKFDCNKVFLALGSIDRQSKLRIIRQLEQFPIQLQTIPPIEVLTKGELSLSNLQDIKIEDLLGRDPVKPNEELMRANIEGKTVMVTGAGGSIGSELCRQIINYNPKSLLLFELNEYSLYKIEQELQTRIHQTKPEIQLQSLLGSVQDQNRLECVMNHYQVQTIYHAAAYKHVPLVEHNIVEGIQNNVFGTLHCANAAINCNVETFVLISTDKAVRSTNIMGASKRLAEIVLQMMSSDDNKTRFSSVRFGNVLGSSGSVVPKFRQQIESGGPVTVTHPDITRYFMTIPEAAQLVVQAGAMAKGGETYVLEMGEPVKIYDLAKEMIRLSGHRLRGGDSAYGSIEIKYTGLRPGEKLYEELLITGNAMGTRHPRITEALETPLQRSEIESILDELQRLCDQRKYEKIVENLLKLPNIFNGKSKPKDNLYISEDKNKPTLIVIQP